MGRRRGIGRPPARRAVARNQRVRRRRRRRRVMVGGAVLLGGGAMVYKLTQKDVDQIEAATGQSVEELTDEQLQQAMKQLGIENQPLTAEDQAALAQVPPVGEDEEMDDAAPAATAAPAAPAAAAPGDDTIAMLEQLGALHQQGILTDEEFAAKKKQILGL